MSFEGKNLYGQYIDYSEKKKKWPKGFICPYTGTIFYIIRIYSRSQVSVYRTIGPLVIIFSANQYAGLFRIDQNDGTITLTRPIASDQSQLTTFKYELQVVATDDGSCCAGSTRRSSTGTVTINLLTDNAMNPEFKTCSGYTPSVDENAVDAFVIQVCIEINRGA